MSRERPAAHPARPPLVGEGRDPELVEEQIAAGTGRATPVRLAVGLFAALALVLAAVLGVLALTSVL